jgi:hypothetical protein
MFEVAEQCNEETEGIQSRGKSEQTCWEANYALRLEEAPSLID